MTKTKGALFALALACLWALAPAHPEPGLPRTVRASATQLVARGNVDLAPFGDDASLPGTVVHAGQRRATSALGAIVALLPAELVGAALGPRDRDGRIIALAEAGTAAATVALLLVVFYGLLVGDGLSPRASLAFTALLGLATPLAWYGRVPDGTALATLLLLVAVRAARRLVSAPDGGTRPAWALGVALGGLVLVEPALLLPALVLLVWCGVHRRAPLGVALALPALAPLAVAVVVVLVWRAHVGARPDRPGDLLEGLDGLLLSTGKSIFLYAPPLMLAPLALHRLWRTRRPEVELLLVVSAATLLAAARLDDWHGDPTWGPRRAVPLVPLALEAVALAWAARPTARSWRLALAVTAAAGLWVQTVGILIAPSVYLDVARSVRLSTGAASWFAEEPSQCHFIPQFSPISGHAWLVSHMVRRDDRFDLSPPYQLLVEHPPRLEGLLPRLRADWFAVGWPPLAAAGWLAALALIAATAAWTIRRRIV